MQEKLENIYFLCWFIISYFNHDLFPFLLGKKSNPEFYFEDFNGFRLSNMMTGTKETFYKLNDLPKKDYIFGYICFFKESD